MKIAIEQTSNGRWIVRIGLIEKEFLSPEMALELVTAKMNEAEESWFEGMQDTSGT